MNKDGLSEQDSGRKGCLWLMTGNLVVFTILFMISELLLQFLGFEPGYLNRYPDTNVPYDVKVLDLFEMDGSGIIHISHDKIDELNNALGLSESQLLSQLSDPEDALYFPISKFLTEYEATLQKDPASPDSISADLEQTISQYLENPINDDGFRSIPFKKTDESPSVLLLGASNTWGVGNNPITMSFADKLLAKGVWAYNSALPYGDLAQNLFIVKKWLPKLQVDHVVLTWDPRMGFDFYKRSAIPPQQLFYASNFGSLPVFIDGQYVTIEDAQSARVSREMISFRHRSVINNLMSKTSTTTQIWKGLSAMGWVYDHEHFPWLDQEEGLAPLYDFGRTFTRDYLSEIQEVCLNNNAKLSIFVLPYSYPGTDLTVKLNEELEGIEFNIIPNLKDSDLKDEYGEHLTNTGSEKYADHIYRIIMK